MTCPSGSISILLNAGRSFVFILPVCLVALAGAAPADPSRAGDPGRGAADAALSDPGHDAVRAAVRAHLKRHDRDILGELADLLRIPNLASDDVNIRKNAARLEAMMRARGFETRLLEVEGSPPVVFGELRMPGAARTLALYTHYDGQPVDPSRWSSDPYRPVLKDPGQGPGTDPIDWRSPGVALKDEWRLYARSASDDKAPIVAIFAALDALRAARIPPSTNLLLFFEGEEEAGSSHLRLILEKYVADLDADLWLMCDGPVHQSRRMQIFYGARGVIGAELTVYGATRPLHSGHYGNWAPNPIVTLTHLLASMRDRDGTIRIAGFSDEVRPLSRAERDALGRIPDISKSLMDDLGLARTEGDGRTIESLIMRPALNLRGIASGNVGDRARNAIPTEASASIDFRLVPDQKPETIRARVEDHLRAQGFHVVREEPDADARRKHPLIVRLEWDHGYPPYRTPLDLPAARGVARVVEEAAGGPIVLLPTLGGSGPIYIFDEVLHAPTIGVPIVNHDNNQHGADENLRLQNLWDGIGIYAALIARLGHHWDQDLGARSSNPEIAGSP